MSYILRLKKKWSESEKKTRSLLSTFGIKLRTSLRLVGEYGRDLQRIRLQ